MPVVFVHGVGVRAGPEYWADLELRKSLMRGFLFEPLGLPASTTVHCEATSSRAWAIADGAHAHETRTGPAGTALTARTSEVPTAHERLPLPQ